MKHIPSELRFYTASNGSVPVQEWLDRFDDAIVNKILRRLKRLQLGNFGDVKSLKGGLHELRIQFGPGYRIYFAQEGATVVILLGAGNKRTQKQDIVKARERYSGYKNRL
jgi:putative addiction module killer protein